MQVKKRTLYIISIIFLVIILAIIILIIIGNQNNNSSPNFNYSNNNMQNAQLTNTTSKVDKYNSAPKAQSLDELKNKQAVFKTAKGDFKIDFFPAEAPKTVSNFIFLIEEKFYDNLTFHRREEGFVLQGGDPKGDGTGGPGYTVEAELSNISHTRGRVAMARLPDFMNPTKASSGSQFYITLDDASFLDNEYTVFGEVVEGMDVIDSLSIGDKILSAEIKTK